MPNLIPPNLDDMIACAQREISQRQYVFPRRVAQGKMSQDKADRELETMVAISNLLKRLKGEGYAL